MEAAMTNVPKAAPNGFALTVAGHIRQVAAQQYDQNPSGAFGQMKAHIITLRATGDLAGGLGDSNGAIVALWRASSILGSPHGYVPGPKQIAVMQTVGLGIGEYPDNQPMPDAVLAHIVSAAIEDAEDVIRRPVQTAIAERDRAVSQLRRLQDRTVDKSELEAARMEIDGARATVEAIQRECQHLRSMLGLGINPAAPPAALEPVQEDPEPEDDGKDMQRTGHEGVFRRKLKSTPGYAYVATWRDRDNKSRKRQFVTEAEAVAHRLRMLEERDHDPTTHRVPDLTAASAAGPEVN
jgi:hypothetical protein